MVLSTKSAILGAVIAVFIGSSFYSSKLALSLKISLTASGKEAVW